MMVSRRFVLLVLSLTALAGCQKQKAPSAGERDSVPPQLAPHTEEKTADGVTLQMLDYDGIQKLIAGHRGKVVVMDAWSTSCPPCLKEFPHLVELHNKLGPDRVACVSLSFDYEGIGKPEEQREPVLAFLQKQGATFDNVLASEESDALYRKFRLTAVPAVFVYDREGQLVKRFDNEQAATSADAFTYEQVGQLVDELLK